MDKTIIDQLVCCRSIIGNILDESYIAKSKGKQLNDTEFAMLYSCSKFLGKIIEDFYKKSLN